MIAESAMRAHPDMEQERIALWVRVRDLIDRLGRLGGPAGGRDDGARDELLLDIARFQARHVAPYRRLVEARGMDPAAATLDEMPAMPTDVFRMARVAAHGRDKDFRVFLTSGTTSGARGAHHVRELGLYDVSARAAAEQALFPDRQRLTLINLVPDEQEAPESSLGYMVARFQEWFGAPDSVYVWQGGRLDVDGLARALDAAQGSGRPVALLGTSFALVFADEALGTRTWRLPAGSRIMQTGGFKGRTRQIEPEAMRAMLAQRYGVGDEWIVAEYGMTELSSQMYENTLAAALRGEVVARQLVAPAWVRVVIVDPETLRPLAPGDGGIGLIRVEDPANVDTAWAVQTSDLGRRVDGGFELLGRASGAVARGCSLAVEEALRPEGGRDD